MTLKDNIRNEIEEGSQQKFIRSLDLFDSLMNENLFELFVNRKVEIQIISRKLGSNYKHESSGLVLNIIGNQGIGKGSVVNLAYQALNEFDSDFRIKSEKNLIITMFKNESFFKHPYRYKGNSTRSIISKFVPGNVITINKWNTLDYWLNLNSLANFYTDSNLSITKICETLHYLGKDCIIFDVYSENNLKEILNKRLNYAKKILKESHIFFEPNLYSDFLDNHFSKIIKVSKGNLIIANRLMAYVFNNPHLLNSKGFQDFISLIKEFRETSFTKKKYEVINFIFVLIHNKHIFEFTTRDIAKRFKTDRTVAWKNLEGLSKKGIIYKVSTGKPSVYAMNRNFSYIYEERLLRKIKQGYFLCKGKEYNILDY